MDLASICQDAECGATSDDLAITSRKNKNKLPPEIWALILEKTVDWELATSLDTYTKLSTPVE